MRLLILGPILLLLSLCAFAQNTPVYPGAVATLPTASNRVSPGTTLSASMTSGDTTITVVSNTLFTVPSGGSAVLTIEAERILVCSKTGTTIFNVCASGRGFDGSSAASHSSGLPVSGNLVAWHINQLNAEVTALETLSLAASYKPTFNIAGTTTCNLSLSYVCEVDFGAGNTTLAFSSPRGSGPYLLRSCQDSVGGRSYTFPGSAIGFSQPDTGAGTTNCTEQSFSYDGTNYQGGATTVPTSSWHGLVAPEQSAPDPASSVDTLYADSATHRWLMNNNNTGAVRVAAIIATGATAMGVGAITSGTCATVVTSTATGTLTTDTVLWSHNSDPTAVTGYTAATTGSLRIVAYPTADNINFKVCNATSSSVTPGAITLNWSVLR